MEKGRSLKLKHFDLLHPFLSESIDIEKLSTYEETSCPSCFLE
jgi:hypothetical protein